MNGLDAAKKAMVIGLDGVAFSLINAYMEKGYLPNFKRILGEGYTLSQMDASVPDVSSTSWTSFITGVNPGSHGIYGFMELREGTYKMSFPNYQNITAPTVWEMIANNTGGKRSELSERFKASFPAPLRSIVMNVPQTFPAMPMNGILTAGFVCPDFKKGTYPAAAYDYLKAIGYLPDIDAQKAATDPDGFFADAFRALGKRREAYAHLMETEQWDLFIGVITETDRIHHFFYDAAYDETHKYHGKFVEFYKLADETVGLLFDAFMSKTQGRGLFMTMSDHGFTPIKKEVYLNVWLKNEGLLRLDASKEFYEQIASGTKAFSMEPARIYINMKGRYPSGTVSAADKDSVVRDVKERLAGFKDGTEEIFSSIYLNSELYSGPSASKGPDIVCLARDGYDLKSTLKKDSVFGRSQFTGMHTRHDAHCILPAGGVPDDRAHIEMLAGIIMENLALS